MNLLLERCHSCVVLVSGHPPFLAENYEDLKEKIAKKEMPPPKVRGLYTVSLSVFALSFFHKLLFEVLVSETLIY